ncbi:hypothetical protein [Halobellus clavatus]|uniref:DUF7847 domain-containing protein n=1 Tax=Halobellus clavatus TaxID=660517 RepID=A0A1H3HJ88_9EURY|nr:hypothetical protein [Halobellus clavatus]SDY14729.1 hypothetical protein SAMN04487946_10774 [Halobellus clavatus]
MSLQIRSSLTGGIGRCLNRNGLLLALAYVFVGAAWQVLLYSAVVAAVGQSAAQGGASALPTVDLPLVVSAGGAVVALVLLQYLTIVAIRTFVGGHTRTIPAEFYTRNIPYVLVNSIIGSLAFGLAIFVGSILFVVPGIIAYVAFIFTLLYIAAEDQSFIAAFRSSWNVTRGNWLRLFGLLVVVFLGITIVPGVLSALTSAVFTTTLGPALATLASGTLTLPFSLLLLGILAEAFTQLRTAQERSEPRTGASAA